jgi:hypothetical protein
MKVWYEPLLQKSLPAWHFSGSSDGSRSPTLEAEVQPNSLSKALMSSSPRIAMMVLSFLWRGYVKFGGYLSDTYLRLYVAPRLQQQHTHNNNQHQHKNPANARWRPLFLHNPTASNSNNHEQRESQSTRPYGSPKPLRTL